MPMLVANGNRVVYRGEGTMLSTAAGEVVPFTSDGDDWYLKVLINNEKVFIRLDVWAACQCLSLERRTTPESRQSPRHEKVSR